jgi:uncharacterized protein (DUF342 family)
MEHTKLMRVYNIDGDIKVSEVKVLKETERQFKLDSFRRRSINKYELGSYKINEGIYCYESEVQAYVEEEITKQIANVQQRIQKDREYLQNLEKSLVKWAVK